MSRKKKQQAKEKTLGIEFYSFENVRNKVNKATVKTLERKGLNQDIDNFSSKDLYGTMPKQNYDLVNKYMKKLIHKKMQTFNSEPSS